MDSDIDQREVHARELVGKVLGGRYRIEALIGLGMMGAVFRGHHLGLGRDVAIKVLHSELLADDEMVGRFKREAAAVSRLDHPNCVRVTDFGEVDTGGMFIAMELLQGQELSKMLDAPMPFERAMEIGCEVLDGLQHAHEQGVIHRDIKPENIYIARTAEGRDQVKILDFGIAKVQEGFGSRTLTQAGMIFGTPHYMSPEQAKGTPLDQRADLYSVGILLYDLVAGHVPFDGPDPIKLLRKQIAEAPPPLPEDVPAPVRAVIFKLLEKNPDDRLPSAAEAKAAIERAVALVRASRRVGPADTPGESRPAPGAPSMVHGKAQAGAKSQRMVFALIGASILVTLAFIVWLLSSGDDDTPEEVADGNITQDASEAIAALLPGDGDDGDDGESQEGKSDDSAQVVEEADEALPEKALRANLASIDALIGSKQYAAAQISIGPLLEVYPDSAPLHWRMGQVLVQQKGPANRVAAIDAYAAALNSDVGLRDNADFMAQLQYLLDDPALRPQAIEIAMTHLGDAGLDRLVAWVNLQRNPLSYPNRHRVMTFLEENGRGGAVNKPLQVALDLWQASAAEYPCAAFDSALEMASKDPDSFITGTLRIVPVPMMPDATPCPDSPDTLRRVREQYDEMYAGIDAIVPAHYRPKTGRRGR
jgi:hypothetical protein